VPTNLSYNEHFSELSNYSSKNLGISFDYPKSLGQPSIPPIFGQTGLDIGPYYINITSRDDVANEVKEIKKFNSEAQDGGYTILVSVSQWDKEKQLLDDSIVSTSINCPESDGSQSTSEQQECKIINIGDQKILTRLFKTSYLGGISKIYSFYAGQKRYDFFVNFSSDIAMEELRKNLDKSEELKIGESILGSLKIAK
jgi:hypothetical protein